MLATVDAARGAGDVPGIIFADDATNAAFGLEASTLVTLNLHTPVGQPMALTVPIEGALFTLELAPHSVRSDVYEVKVQLPDGSYQAVDPGPVRTMRGTVTEVEGSVVAASLMGDGLYARINFPGGNTFWLEPLGSKVAGAGVDEYVVYHADDVIPSGGTCIELDAPNGAAAAQESGSEGTVATGGLFFTELGIDVDFEYYQRFDHLPDPIAAIEDDVNSVINAVNAQQYEPQVAIRHLITTIIIRAAEPDPYPRNCSGGTNNGGACTSSTDCPGGSCPFVDAVTLLYRFRDHWNTEQTSVPHDVAQLFTDKNLNGSTIGVAWVGTVCGSSGYSLVQSNCCGSFACRTDLSAHELGHNWGATHCGGNDCNPSCPNTMNCALTCANEFREPFCSGGVNDGEPCSSSLDCPPDGICPRVAALEIREHRDTRSCIDKGDELRRIIVSAPSTTLPEGGSMQFTATADFTFGEDQDITNDVTWSSQPPEAGFISASGLFTALNVNGDMCVDVTATFELRGEIHERTRTILVEDLDGPQALVNSNPPNGAVDARQPSQPDGSFPTGLRTVDVILTGDVCFMTRFDFDVTQIGGFLADPSISSIEPLGPRTVRVLLNRDIEPGAWTVVTHPASGTSVQVGYLPADVSEDGVVDGADLLALVDALSGMGDPLPLRSTDLDRSGRLGPADLVRALDLMNGADAFQPWYLRSLP